MNQKGADTDGGANWFRPAGVSIMWLCSCAGGWICGGVSCGACVSYHESNQPSQSGFGSGCYNSLKKIKTPLLSFV